MTPVKIENVRVASGANITAKLMHILTNSLESIESLDDINFIQIYQLLLLTMIAVKVYTPVLVYLIKLLFVRKAASKAASKEASTAASSSIEPEGELLDLNSKNPSAPSAADLEQGLRHEHERSYFSPIKNEPF